jgi:hypothetical protein
LIEHYATEQVVAPDYTRAKFFFPEAASRSRNHGEPRPQVRKEKFAQQRGAKALAIAKNRPAETIETLQAVVCRVCFLR